MSNPIQVRKESLYEMVRILNNSPSKTMKIQELSELLSLWNGFKVATNKEIIRVAKTGSWVEINENDVSLTKETEERSSELEAIRKKTFR